MEESGKKARDWSNENEDSSRYDLILIFLSHYFTNLMILTFSQFYYIFITFNISEYILLFQKSIFFDTVFHECL